MRVIDTIWYKIPLLFTKKDYETEQKKETTIMVCKSICTIYSVLKTKLFLGSGSVLAAATTAACRDPVILGKPSTYMFEALMITHPEVKPSRTLMIGDK